MHQNPHQAFLHAYEPLHSAFIRYCSTICYGIMDAEDLAHETILITLERYDDIREKEKLLGYMIAVANNVIRNKRRRLKFRGYLDEEAFKRLETKAPGPEVALDIHYLYQALRKLPEKQREAIILFEINGFSIKEISDMQGSSISATKTRLSRGRQKLKSLMEEKVSDRLVEAYITFLFTLTLECL